MPKQAQDLSLLKSFHPTSLLDTGYKILTTLLGTRLGKRLDKYIHYDQAGFIKSCQLRDHVRLICNIINHVQDSKIPMLLYLCGAEKAFDRVQWGFLKKVMQRIGFGSFFMAWVMQIHSTQEAEIALEGCKSRRFPLSRRVRQVCTLSPLLFNIVIETLAIMVKSKRTS